MKSRRVIWMTILIVIAGFILIGTLVVLKDIEVPLTPSEFESIARSHPASIDDLLRQINSQREWKTPYQSLMSDPDGRAMLEGTTETASEYYQSDPSRQKRIQWYDPQHGMKDVKWIYMVATHTVIDFNTSGVITSYFVFVDEHGKLLGWALRDE